MRNFFKYSLYFGGANTISMELTLLLCPSVFKINRFQFVKYDILLITVIVKKKKLLICITVLSTDRE